MNRHWILLMWASMGLNVVFANSKDILEVSFQSEGYTLKGKMIIPTEKEKEIPAIIFLVGSGGNSSYATDYKEFLRFFLETPLEAEEVAFLYFDKRGVGQSEGKWFKTDFEQRAVDAKNAAAYLKTLDYINSDKIYVVGHSQGGWIVQLCLANDPDYFAGGVSMAGPTFDVKKQLINDYQSRIICAEDLSEEEAYRKAKRRVHRDLTIVTLFPFQEDWKQLKTIRKFDPKPYLTKIEKPLLLMWAENDALVNPGWSLESLHEFFPSGIPEAFTTYIALGENHSFQTSLLCFRGVWSSLEYSENSRNRMREWLKVQLND